MTLILNVDNRSEFLQGIVKDKPEHVNIQHRQFIKVNKCKQHQVSANMKAYIGCRQTILGKFNNSTNLELG